MEKKDIINKLHKDHRYLFLQEYVSCKNKKIQRYFRANLHEIINDTLVVKLYNECNNSTQIWGRSITSMPITWIKKILSLEDIIGGKSKIPVEILHIIDSYIA